MKGELLPLLLRNALGSLLRCDRGARRTRKCGASKLRLAGYDVIVPRTSTLVACAANCRCCQRPPPLIPLADLPPPLIPAALIPAALSPPPLMPLADLPPPLIPPALR